jgi:hypothetical protein
MNPTAVRDLLCLGGVAFATVGLWWLSPAIALVVLGLLLLAAGLASHWWRGL